MNKKRRNRIVAVVDELTEIMDEENEYLENIPENLQGSLKYDESEEASSLLQEAIDVLSEIV